MRGKVRFFVDVEGDDYGPFYSGDADNIPEAKKGVANLLESYLHELKDDPEETITVYLTAKRMTDEEVAALPEL